MKKVFKTMAFTLLGLVLSSNLMWASKGDEVAKVTVATLAGTNDTYACYSNDDWVMTVASKTVFGTNAKSGNDGKLKLSNSTNTSSENSAIASAIASYTKGTFTVNDQYVAALIGKSKLTNVGKVTITYSGTNGGTPDNIWVLAATEGNSYSVVAATTTMTSPITFEFNTIASAKYAIVGKRTASFGLKGTPVFAFYEGETSGGVEVNVESVGLDQTSKTIEIGEQFTLTPTILPADATNKNVTWSSSASTKASVNNGVVTGVAEGNAIITVTTVDGSKTATCNVTVTKPVGDKLTPKAVGNKSSYAQWDNAYVGTYATYIGYAMGGSSYFQLKSNDNVAGIVSTVSGGNIAKVKVTWNSSTTSGRVLDIYGSNDAYTAASDLYNNDKKGTKIGSIKYGESTEFIVSEGEYAYVGIRSASGALYLDDITFVWEAEKTLTKVEVTTPPTKNEYTAKDTFVPAGMEVTLTYDDESEKVIAYSSTDTKWSFEPALTDPLKVSDDIIVTYDDVEAEDFVDITVNPLPTTITAENRKVEEDSEIADLNEWCSVGDYDGTLTFESSNEDALVIIEESSALAGDAGEETTLTITAPATNYYAQASKAITVTVVSAIPEYDVVWSAQTGSFTGGQLKVLEGSAVEELPNFDEATVCDGNSFMGWTNEEIPTPTNTPPSVLFKTADDAPPVHSTDVTDNKVTYYAVYAKNKVQDYKKVTSIATGDEVIIALEDNNGKPVTGVTGANTSTNKDATVSNTEAQWLVFTIEDGGKFKNGDNYIVAAEKSFSFGVTGTALSVNENSYLIFNDGSKDIPLKRQINGTSYYYRFYTNTTDAYTPFYVYSAKKNIISGYSTTCTAPVTINDPTILPEEREIAAASQEVTITQTQTGVGEISIYYTIDGTEPTTASTKYKDGFMIGEGTTVVKAIAADNAGNQSSVVTATFKLDKGYVSTIAEFLAKDLEWTGEIRFTTENFAVITARSADGKTIYMQDATGAICVYTGSSTGLVKAAAINSKVVGTVSGKRANNAGVPELISGQGQFPATSITTGGERPTPIEIEAVNEAAWNANPCKLVTLKNVYYSTSSNGHYTFKNEGGTESNDIYDSFGILSGKTMPETTAKCNITGIMICYGYTYELAPALIEEIKTDQSATLPSLTLNGEAETTPSTDELNPKKVDYLSLVVVTPAEKTSLVINGEALTEATKTFNISTATTIAITAKRDFYVDNTVTYYYAPAQTPYNITIKENSYGSAVAKVGGVEVTTALNTNTVTIVVTPNAHWNLNQSKWSIKDANGDGVPYTEVFTNNFNFTMPESDVTVTLSFTQDPKYSIEFDRNGDAEGEDPTIDDQYVGAEVILPNNPYTWENHSFQGWIVTDAATGKTIVPQSEGKFTMPAYNVNITAQWKEIQNCRISFVVAGVEQSFVNQPQEEKYTITETAVAPEGFEFKGWSLTNVEDETQDPATLVTEYTPTTDETAVSLYAVFSYTKQTATYGKYVKVTSAPTDWSGDYLITNNVNDSKVMVLKGGQTTTFTASDEVTESADGVIDGAETINGYKVTLSGNNTNGYTIKYNSGYYLSYNSDKNGISASNDASKAIAYSVSYDNTNSKVVIQCPVSSGAKFQYYTNDKIFKFYKSNQAPIQLYKLDKGTIYYTSYPVAKVSITFDKNGGDKACDNEMINKGSELTICDDVPAQRGKEFKYWEDAAHNTYNPGETYTFNEDATLTAQWDNLPVRHITYNINGGTGATPVDANDYYKDDQVMLASGEGIEKDGFAFNGWKVTYNETEVTVTAGKFYMPDADVTATAQWRDERVSYWHLVTNTNMLKAGDQVIVAAAGNYLHAMGVENNNLRGVVTIEKEKDTEHFDDEKIKYTTSPVVFTLEEGTVDGTFSFYDGENYLATSSSSNKISHSATKTNEASWEITIDANGKTQVVAQGTNTCKHLKYNTDRFCGYSSETSCMPVALYKYIEGEKAVREVTSGAYTTFCIPQGVKVGNFYGATFWNIEKKSTMGADNRLSSITIVEHEENVEAGVPYIMLADENVTEFVYYATGEAVDNPAEEGNNGLVGVFENTPFANFEGDAAAIDAAAAERGYYVISGGLLYLCGNNCGVYANYAYIVNGNITDQSAKAPAHAARRTIGNPNGTPTTLNGLFGNKNIKAQKALVNGNIYILRENKMYNAQGILVK